MPGKIRPVTFTPGNAEEMAKTPHGDMTKIIREAGHKSYFQ